MRYVVDSFGLLLFVRSEYLSGVLQNVPSINVVSNVVSNVAAAGTEEATPRKISMKKTFVESRKVRKTGNI